MEVIGKLTPGQAKLFADMAICKEAVKELVTEAIRHYEESVRLNQGLWRGVFKQFNVPADARDRLELDHVTLEVKMLTRVELAEKKLEKTIAAEVAARLAFDRAKEETFPE